MSLDFEKFEESMRRKNRIMEEMFDDKKRHLEKKMADIKIKVDKIKLPRNYKKYYDDNDDGLNELKKLIDVSLKRDSSSWEHVYNSMKKIIIIWALLMALFLCFHTAMKNMTNQDGTPIPLNANPPKLEQTIPSADPHPNPKLIPDKKI